MSALCVAGISELAAYSSIDADGVEAQALARLGVVNLFVGPNNAGKSRLLRGLLKAEHLKFRVAGIALERRSGIRPSKVDRLRRRSTKSALA